jgi:hypothetical protein
MMTFLIKKESCQEFSVDDMVATARGLGIHHLINGPVSGVILEAGAVLMANRARRETTETGSVCGAAWTAPLAKVNDLLLCVPSSIASTDSVLFMYGLACLVIGIVGNDHVRRVSDALVGGGYFGHRLVVRYDMY